MGISRPSSETIAPMRPAAHPPGTPGCPATPAETNAPLRPATQPPVSPGRSEKLEDGTGAVVAGNRPRCRHRGASHCPFSSEEETIVIVFRGYTRCTRRRPSSLLLKAVLVGERSLSSLQWAVVHHCCRRRPSSSSLEAALVVQVGDRYCRC